jgi:hypothetical protein
VNPLQACDVLTFYSAMTLMGSPSFWFMTGKIGPAEGVLGLVISLAALYFLEYYAHVTEEMDRA